MGVLTGVLFLIIGGAMMIYAVYLAGRRHHGADAESAQREAQAVVEDARTKAELIVKEAELKAKDLLVEVRAQAEREGLDVVFTAAGAEWRAAGCSMCLGMNPDKLAPGERSASTSNRNFEGRQGKGGRTHLVSPEVAAATAVTGHLAAPADL